MSCSGYGTILGAIPRSVSWTQGIPADLLHAAADRRGAPAVRDGAGQTTSTTVPEDADVRVRRRRLLPRARLTPITAAATDVEVPVTSARPTPDAAGQRR